MKIDTDIVEDVAIGKLLKINEISPVKGKRKDIESHKDIRNIDSDEYHIWCRIDSFGYSRNLEKILTEFHFLFHLIKNEFFMNL